MKDKQKTNYFIEFLICVCLMLAVAAVYYQVWTYDFVNYDDSIYIYDNPHIRDGITLKTIKWAFTTRYSHMYHPLAWLSHTIDWQLFGANPGGHHFTNLFLHIANTLLLFFVLKQMTRTLWQSAFIAALFALHPLHVESVAWVTERKDVLSTFFWLLTILAYIRYVKRPKITNYLLIAVFFALGLLSKPMAVTLPFVLLLLDYWPLERLSFKRGTDSSKHSLLYLLVEKIPLFVMVLLLCIVTFIYQDKGEVTVSLGDFPLKFRIYNALISYVRYIMKMIWPARLTFFYPHPGLNVSLLYAVISAVILMIITILVLLFFKNRRYLITGWFWFLGMLVPVIGIVQSGSQAMADRYSYMTLTGLFIIIAWGLPELLRKWQYRKIALWASSLIVLSALAIQAHIQQRYWKNTIMLCEHALNVTDNNYEAHFSIAGVLREQGRTEEAIQHYTEVIRIIPHYVAAFNGLGMTLHKAGRIDEAIYLYERAIKINPRAVDAYVNLGIALIDKGKYADAISLYNKAFKVAPDSVELHINLGSALTKSGQFEEAIKEYEKVLNVEPQNAFARINIGTTLAESGRLEEAVKEYEKVLNIEPQNVIVRSNLGAIFFQQGKFEDAAREYRKVLQIKPDSPDALNVIGIILNQQDKLDEAFKCFTEILRLDPNHSQAHYYLGQILAQRSKIDEAIAHFEEALRLEPNWIKPMNDLAWYLAANEKTKAHNPDRAVKFAQRACELTNYKSLASLDTLAVAYAAAGNFSKAIEITQKALELCRHPEQKAIKEELNGRQVLYKAGKPYIER